MRSLVRVAVLLIVPTAASAVDISWNNAAGGNWGVAANWNPAMVPGAMDNALITLGGTYTVTLNVDATVASLMLGGATGTQMLSNTTRILTLSGASVINANGVYAPSGGTTAGAGLLTVNGTLEWSGGNLNGPGSIAIQAGGGLNISGGAVKNLQRSINNAGTTTWTDTGNISSGSGAVFTNQTGGTLLIQNDQSWSFSLAAPASQIVNEPGATLRKHLGGGSTTFSNIRFTNAGAVAVDTGILVLSGGGSASAPIAIAAGSRVDFTGSTFTLNAGAAFTGAGTPRVANGTLTVAADVSAVDLTLESGTLNGGAMLSVTGTLTWTGGAMSGTGLTRIPMGAALNISGSAVKNLQRSINNAGTTTWTGTGNISSGSGAVFTNQTGGTLLIQNDQSWSFSLAAPTSQIVNQAGATLSKNPGGGTTTFSNIPFSNAGAVAVDTGILVLSGGGSASAPIAIAAGSRVDFTSSTFTLNAGAAFTGAGTPRVANGTLTVAADVSAVDLTLESGTLNGGAMLTVTDTLTWTGGAMSGTGLTRIPMGAALNISGDAVKILQRSINNAGTTTWTGTGNISSGSGAVFTNQTGGTLLIQNDQSWSFSLAAPASQIVNQAGATLSKNPGAGTTNLSNLPVSNAGTTNAQSGTLAFNGSYTQTAGATHLAGGHLASTGTIAIQGGVLDGTGNVGATLTNTGTVSPGTSPGRIAVTGSVNHGVNGNLSIEINGAAPLTEYDQLTVVGPVTLGGALQVSFGFSAAAGTSFTIIDNDAVDAVNGTFTGLPEGTVFNANGTDLRISYVGGTGNDVVLTVGGGTSATNTPTATSGATATATATASLTRTATILASATPTSTGAATATSSATRSSTATAMLTSTPTATRTATASSTPTATGAATATASATPSQTPTGPSASPTSSSTAQQSPTSTATASITATAPATDTATAVSTSTLIVTATPTATPTVGQTAVGGFVFRPGARGQGLVGVAGATVTAAFCEQRNFCLDTPGPRVGTAVTEFGGRFTMQVPDLPNLLLFEVLLDGVPLRHVLVTNRPPGITAPFGTAGFPEVRIDPISEAVVRLLDDAGLANFDDGGIQAVADAVRDANADTVFDELSVEAAAALATDTAADDPEVERVLSERATPTPSATPGGCPGDCNGTGVVSIDELVRSVNIALGNQDLASCPAVDRGGDGRVTIDDLIAAVSALLVGCPV